MAVFTNETKNSATFTNETKNSATWDTSYKSGKGLIWNDADQSWNDTPETWEQLGTTSWSEQTKN